MVKLEMSPRLGRKIRREGWSELGIPTWTLAAEAIQAGHTKEGLNLVEHARNEVDYVHRVMLRSKSLLLDYIAERWGEEEVGRAWMALSAGMSHLRTSHSSESIDEAVQIDAQAQRGHFCGRSELGDLSVVEETDRYVVTMDPCGTGGGLRRAGVFGATKKAYPWSWGKTGVNYHCVHCCIFWEITAIEARGYPTRVHENVDQPQAPCIHYYYKSPELIPEHYFTRVGKKKDPSRFPNSKRQRPVG